MLGQLTDCDLSKKLEKSNSKLIAKLQIEQEKARFKRTTGKAEDAIVFLLNFFTSHCPYLMGLKLPTHTTDDHLKYIPISVRKLNLAGTEISGTATSFLLYLMRYAPTRRHTIQYHTTPYNTLLYNTTPHHIVQHHTIEHTHHTAPHHTTPYNTTPYSTTPHHTTLHHTTPHHTTLINHNKMPPTFRCRVAESGIQRDRKTRPLAQPKDQPSGYSQSRKIGQEFGIPHAGRMSRDQRRRPEAAKNFPAISHVAQPVALLHSDRGGAAVSACLSDRLGYFWHSLVERKRFTVPRSTTSETGELYGVLWLWCCVV